MLKPIMIFKYVGRRESKTEDPQPWLMAHRVATQKRGQVRIFAHGTFNQPKK